MNFLAMLDAGLDELLDRIRPVLAVVWEKRRGVGAGVLVGEGLVLTNQHVVGGARHLQVVLENEQTFHGQLIVSDAVQDLALLHFPSSGNAIAVLSMASPRPGELVFAFGHPWGQRNVLTGGVISAVTETRGRHGNLPILRSDVQLAPGNSGGPLLNTAGEVIGLNTMIFGGDQSVAIPTSVIREFLESMQKKRSGRRSAEGIS